MYSRVASIRIHYRETSLIRQTLFTDVLSDVKFVRLSKKTEKLKICRSYVQDCLLKLINDLKVQIRRTVKIREKNSRNVDPQTPLWN